MTHKLIKTENYLIVVDDSEIKEGNAYIRIDNELLFSSLKGSNPHIVEKYCKKILAHLPLNNSPILKGVPLLPPLEDDIEKLALINAQTPIKEHREQDISTEIWISGARQLGFKEGYNKAKEKYKYTEEDMRIAIQQAFLCGVERLEDFGKVESMIIGNIQQPKYPVAFDLYMTHQRLGVTWIMSEIIRNNQSDLEEWKPKTITNSQGQTQLVGTYIYENKYKKGLIAQ